MPPKMNYQQKALSFDNFKGCHFSVSHKCNDQAAWNHPEEAFEILPMEYSLEKFQKFSQLTWRADSVEVVLVQNYSMIDLFISFLTSCFHSLF
jgi:hypothetical protein